MRKEAHRWIAFFVLGLMLTGCAEDRVAREINQLTPELFSVPANADPPIIASPKR